MDAQTLSQFIKVFLITFGIGLFFVSLYLYKRPHDYWRYTQQSLKFKGIINAKPTKRFDWWIRTSAIVQMVMGILALIAGILTK